MVSGVGSAAMVDINIHKKIPNDEVKLLWHNNYWDGPLEGLCQYQGQEYYYECFDENEDRLDGNWYRRFALYQMTPEQLNEEKRWHELFLEKVGTHWEGGSVKPEESWPAFYGAYKEWKRPAYEPVVGWFEE